MLVISKRFTANAEKIGMPKIKPMSQSRTLFLMKAYMYAQIAPKQKKDRQSNTISRQNTVRTFFDLDVAYWIEDGTVFSAEHDNQEIDYETKNVVDMMAIDSIELKKMTFIVEKLTEGATDDRGNPGKS